MSICKDCLHNEVCTYGENRSNGMYCTGDKCKQYKPTADVVEVVHGEWLVSAWDGEKEITIPYQEHEHIDPYCSICQSQALLDGEELGVASNYCPNCGAKMDGGRREG